ncbi:MAG TPA: patatin-like phospholipase family protein [Myxococcales bacterium]
MADSNLEAGTGSRLSREYSAAELSALLSGAPFLEGLAPGVVADVAAACDLLQIPGDRQLLRKDVPNDSLYVVVHGGLRTVARDARGRERVFFEAYRGDSVGVVGLVPGVSAPVDVFAIRDSLVLRLPRERFRRLGERHPDLVMRLAGGIARRGLGLLGNQPEWTTFRRPGAAAQNIALLVPSRDAGFARAAADLARSSLEAFRSVGRVTRQSLDAALGAGASATPPTGPENERVLAYLQGLEPGHEIVLYECDTTMPAWSERCLRQADRVLVIVRADRPEHAQEIRAALEATLQREQGPQFDVAVVHPEHAEVPGPSDADRARMTRNARVHHVRMGNRGDYERLARTLVRTGIALVLSGGGARGIAHLGVLKAMEDAGIPVDAIGGTSMGAIFAAGYARGWSASTLLDRVRELFRSRVALYDPTFPFHSLLAGRKLERVMRTFFGGLDIENLWLPFFCVSTNLSRAEPRVHDRGELWPAVAASCSIPGIFPPRREGADRLVDGGVMNNLPIDVMASRFEGAIIASDVSPHGEAPQKQRAHGRVRSFLSRLWRGPGTVDQGPGIFEILTRATMVGSQHTTLSSLARGEASLLLTLPVARFRMLEWSAHDELFSVGYEHARQLLATWEPPWVRSAARPAT